MTHSNKNVSYLKEPMLISNHSEEGDDRQFTKVKTKNLWVEQNMPPQNTPLWHVDYFALKFLKEELDLK